MVDIVSDTGSVRTIRRVSESFRLHLPLQPGKHLHWRHPDSEERRDNSKTTRVRLEVQENAETGEMICRLIDLESGAVIQTWDGNHLAELRAFLQQHRIQLIDRKV